MTEEKPTRLYREMTWPQIAEAGRTDIPVAIPIGSTEQHGHHLPVYTDWLIPEKLLEAASRRCDLVVGQFVPFGYCSRPAAVADSIFQERCRCAPPPTSRCSRTSSAS
jgi:creatinine amidohydrolase